MVFSRSLKTSIKRTLTLVFLAISITGLASIAILNAVFAATDFRIPIEIIWSDQSASTRPSQVILHVRRSGSTENLKTVTLTSANQDPNNANKWVYTINDFNYTTGYSYQIYQEDVANYSVTQFVNVTATSQLNLVNHAQTSLNGKNKSKEFENTNFVLVKINKTGDYVLWTRDYRQLSTLNGIIHENIDPDITISSSNYEDGASYNFGSIEVSSDNYDTVTVHSLKGGSYTIYYGWLDNMYIGSTASFTNTLNVTYNLTVHHLNEDGTAFAPDVVTEYDDGDTYTASPIVNNRYTPELTIGQATGIITADTEVTYVYHPKFHTVTYQFAGDVLPPNADQLLPAVAEHDDGTTVTIAQNPTAEGYRFLGWKIGGESISGTFTMPSENVTITGSWERFNGYFAPSISKQVINSRNVYRYGDTVEFQIYITNTASFPIYNIEVSENLAGARFLTASGYEIISDGVANIVSIPANGTVVLYAEFDIAENVTQTLTNTVEITSASAENYYFLDTDQDYTASAQFVTQSWQDVPVLTGINTNSTILYPALMALGAVGVGWRIVVINLINKEREK